MGLLSRPGKAATSAQRATDQEADTEAMELALCKIGRSQSHVDFHGDVQRVPFVILFYLLYSNR